MPARVVWEGLEELKEALRRLPEALRDDAIPLVLAAADATEIATFTNYPERTGNLRKGVGQKQERSAFGVIAIVYSRAPHAHLYENGTRHSAPAPPHKRLGTHAARERRKMYAALRAMLESHGLEVSGDA